VFYDHVWYLYTTHVTCPLFVYSVMSQGICLMPSEYDTTAASKSPCLNAVFPFFLNSLPILSLSFLHSALSLASSSRALQNPSNANNYVALQIMLAGLPIKNIVRKKYLVWQRIEWLFITIFDCYIRACV